MEKTCTLALASEFQEMFPLEPCPTSEGTTGDAVLYTLHDKKKGIVVDTERIELPTPRLQGECSTI